MKKKFLPITLLILLVSAMSFAQTNPMPGNVGGDRDSHGCIGSAGYTYSILKKDCIRLFEEKIQLKEVNPSGTSTSNLAIIFSDDFKKAEVFLPEDSKSIILIRSGKKGKYIWKKGTVLLVNNNGYILKKDSKIIFSQITNR